MTEKEVLEKFDRYGEAIKKLLQKKSDLEKEVENLNNLLVDSQTNFDLANRNYQDLKTKTFGTVRHLVEEVIEPMEKKLNTPQRGDVKALEEVVHLKEENQNLLSQISTMGSERNYLSQHLDSLQSENLALREQVEDKDQEILSLSTTIGLKDSEIESLKLKLEELSNQPKIISQKSVEVLPYKFAKISKETMGKICNFIDFLFENVDEREDTMLLGDTMKCAEKAQLSEREVDVFTRRFSEMKVNGLPLIGFDNGIAHSTFKPDWIKQYISTITY